MSDAEAVRKKIGERVRSYDSQIEELSDKRDQYTGAIHRMNAESTHNVETRYRGEHDTTVSTLAGPGFDESVDRTEFLAVLVAECELSLPEARRVLDDAVDRHFWVISHQDDDVLHENGNVNPASQQRPDLSCCDEEFSNRTEYFEHLEGEHPVPTEATPVDHPFTEGDRVEFDGDRAEIVGIEDGGYPHVIFDDDVEEYHESDEIPAAYGIAPEKLELVEEGDNDE